MRTHLSNCFFQSPTVNIGRHSLRILIERHELEPAEVKAYSRGKVGRYTGWLVEFAPTSVLGTDFPLLGGGYLAK
jgi:hypothetical protein